MLGTFSAANTPRRSSLPLYPIGSLWIPSPGTFLLHSQEEEEKVKLWPHLQRSQTHLLSLEYNSSELSGRISEGFLPRLRLMWKKSLPFLFFHDYYSPYFLPHVCEPSWETSGHICHLSGSLMNSFDLSLSVYSHCQAKRAIAVSAYTVA